ncbi:MAG: outer membrane beta-barrel protein [Gemmatimonadales bacterium]
MRLTLWCAMACGVPRFAAAQDSSVTFQESRAVTVSGFAVGTYEWDRNARANTFAGSKVALSLFRPWSDNLYLFGQLTTHLEAPEDSAGEAQTHIEIDNLIVSWTPPGAASLTLALGRFDAPLGFERGDEPLNLVPTNGFNFALARPAKLTGAIARYTASPRWAIAAYVANGWNAELDVNRGKTAGVRVDLLPAEGIAVGFNALYGPEVAGTDAEQRTLLAADATLQPASRLILGAELNRGSQRVAGPTSSWTGVAGTAFWRVGRTVGLTARGETLRDRDGVASGTPQTLQSLTIAPWYFYREAQEGVFSSIERTSFRLPAFSLRPALRIDHSDQPVFQTSDGGFRRTNVRGIIELVYIF